MLLSSILTFFINVFTIAQFFGKSFCNFKIFLVINNKNFLDKIGNFKFKQK